MLRNNKKITASISIVAVGFFISLVALVGGVVVLHTKKSESVSREIRSDARIQQENTNREETDEQKALALLPKEVLLYEVQKNGFNQDKTLYSVNAYISLAAEGKLEKAGFSNMDFQKYAGCWIVNVRDTVAYRISTVGQDYNFYRWMSNNRIELVGDGKKTATTYNALTGDVMSKRIFNLDNSVDISKWKEYRNSEENFEVKYPAGVVIQEKHENFVDDITNRYVSFYDPETDATIYLGVKQKSENNIMPKPFRTGIPGGEFLSRGDVAFGDGFAREVRLVDCYFPGENRCAVELIWFCGADDVDDFSQDSCSDGDIRLGTRASAFMEVSLTKKSNVESVTKLVHGMIRSFRLL